MFLDRRQLRSIRFFVFRISTFGALPPSVFEQRDASGNFNIDALYAFTVFVDHKKKEGTALDCQADKS